MTTHRAAAPPRLAKLSPPSASAIVARPRLLARLAGMLAATRHGWIVAPAGSGKTSLLASFCATRTTPVLWYRVDEGDADPASFLHYFARAARQLGAPADSDAWNEAVPSSPAGYREWLRRFLAQLPDEVLIVLDDFHEVSDVAAVQELIATLIAEAPQGVSVCVASRANPEGALARCYAEGGVIDHHDLLLSDDEARNIAATRQMTDPSVVERAYASSEGWPTGFLLLLRASMQAGGRSVESLESARLVADFFSTDVWPHIDAASRDLLLRTAWLNVVTPAAAVRLTQREDAPELLDALVERHLLVTRLQYGEGCVYHPLLRSYVSRKAEESFEPAELARLKLESARIMEEAGDDAQVAGLLAGMKAWSDLAAFIERNASRLIAQGRNATVESWIRLLPSEWLDRSSWCRYWLGAALMGRDPSAAYSQFEASFRQMDEQGDASGASDACRAAMDALFWEGGPAAAAHRAPVSNTIGAVIAMAQRVMPKVSGLHFGGFAMIASAPGHPLTRRLVEEAQSVYASSTNPTLRVQAANLLTAWHIIRGDHALASSICNECESLGWRDDVPAPIRLLWLTGIAIHRWSIGGDPEGAIELVERAYKLVKTLDVPAAEHLLLCQRGCAEIAADHLDDAARTLACLRAIPGTRKTFDRGNELYVEAALKLKQGDAAAACDLFEAAVKQMDSTIFAVWATAHRVALVQGLLAADRPQDALREIRAIHAFAKRAGSAQYRWLAQMAEADALLRLGRTGEADQALAQALVLGRTKCLFALPMAPDNAFAPLFERALALGIENDYVRALAARHRVRPRASASDAWPWPVKVYVLGSFRLLIDDHPVSFGRKAQRRPLALLQAIVAHGGRDVPVSVMASDLWPDADGDAAEHACDVTLQRLRRLLGDLPVIEHANRRFTLSATHCWTDVGALRLCLDEIEPALAPASPPLREATLRALNRCLALYRGPLLSTEEDEPWVLEWRTRYRTLVARAVSAAARKLHADGRQSEAARLCAQLLDRDPETAKWLPEWARVAPAGARTFAPADRPAPA